MTHEPDCQKADLGCGQYSCVEVCICDEIRAAYQRGREDAANAVERVEWWQGRVETHNGPEWGRHCDRDLAIAAARGGGRGLST